MTTGAVAHLAERLKRLDSLEAAQRVLGVARQEAADPVNPSGLAARIRALARSHSDLSVSGFRRIDEALSRMGAGIQHEVLNSPPGRLATRIDHCRTRDRGALIALLDVLIGEEPSEWASAEKALSAIRALLVGLCRSPDPDVRGIGCDPVFLTPRFHAFSEWVQEPDARSIDAIELEFFAAANLEVEALRDVESHRERSRLQAALGLSVFSPRMVRAVVTYEVALAWAWPSSSRSASALADLEVGTGARFEGSDLSVFSSGPFLRLAEAVKRRLQGAQREPTAEGRIAWALDVESLRPPEREALRGIHVGTAQDPLGTTILVGLLARHEKVLGFELQEFGIPPNLLMGAWRKQLASGLQSEIHASLQREEWAVSSALTDLKARFLGSHGLIDSETQHVAGAKGEVDRPRRKPVHDSARGRQAPDPKSARSLVKAAMRDHGSGRSARVPQSRFRRGWPRVAMSLVLGVLIVAWAVSFTGQRPAALAGLSVAELQSLSPYLESGGRTLDGTGPGFVGIFDERWAELPEAPQRAAAESLVARLRSSGISQIVIRDDRDRVRLQALGRQPLRLL